LEACFFTRVVLLLDSVAGAEAAGAVVAGVVVVSSAWAAIAKTTAMMVTNANFFMDSFLLFSLYIVANNLLTILNVYLSNKHSQTEKVAR
jgi:hypothetical protein